MLLGIIKSKCFITNDGKVLENEIKNIDLDIPCDFLGLLKSMMNHVII